MKEIEKLRPLPRLIHSFGVLPDSYVASMSYHEQLTWFCNYLQTVVIPTVNENAEAGQELQNLFTELSNYVNNYFDNLDIQNEVNNKIDEMISSGVFDQIIEQYLNSSAIWGFDNVESMKNATNLIEGSFAQTLGYHEKNDDGKALYKIRKITNNDNIDNMFIIPLSNNNLIAELIYNSVINIKQLGAYGNNINDDYQVFNNAINTIKNKNINTLYIPSGEYIITNNITIDYPLNISGDYSEYTGSYTNEKLGTILIDNYNGNDPFIKYENNTGTYPNNRIWGVKIENLQIKSNNKNHIGLYLKKTGWNGLIKNLYIRDIKNTGLYLDKVFDTKFDNVQLINCGSNTSENINYALYIGDTDNNDTSNNLHFDSMHIEGSRYTLYLDRSKNNTFNSCKFEDRINANESDSSNSEIYIGNYAQENSFIGCQFIGLDINSWGDIDISNIPYMIDINFTSNRSKAILFDSCSFSSPSSNGVKFLKSNNYTQLSNCSFRVCCNKYYSLDITNALINNCSFIISNNETGISNVSIIRARNNNYIDNCLFQYYESQNIPVKYAIDLGDNYSCINNSRFLGFTAIYTYTNQSNTNFNNSFLQRNKSFINLTDNKYKELMNITTIDYNNVSLDVSKFSEKLISLNLGSASTIKDLINGLVGDEITLLNNTNNVYTIGGDFDYGGSKIRGSESSSTITLNAFGTCTLMKYTNFWKVISKN